MSSTKELPSISETAHSPTSPPARGKEMRNNLLSKLRPPALVHAWDFWHEKAPSSTAPTATNASYTPILTHLLAVTDVRAFWSLFNNFSFGTLPTRSSAHLFHHSIQPLWEDPRNARGGCWIFRVPKAQAEALWKEVCLLAIGEQLQAAVENRVEDEGGIKGRGFKDDICGITFSPRERNTSITIWTRDAEHKEGIQRVLNTVLEDLDEHVTPEEGTYRYKKHAEHDGFGKVGASGEQVTEPEVEAGISADMDAVARQMEIQVNKVRKILEDVRLSDQAMERRLAVVNAGADASKTRDAQR